MYCENCHAEQKTHIETREMIFRVKGDLINVKGDVLVCDACNEELFDMELSSKMQQKAYSIYRENHQLLQPDKIVEIRKQYGLSATDFSLALGMGAKTITRYENGGIQSTPHNIMMELAKDEQLMRKLYHMNIADIPDSARIRIEKKLFGSRSVFVGRNSAYIQQPTRKTIRSKNTCKTRINASSLSFCYQNQYLEYAYAS